MRVLGVEEGEGSISTRSKVYGIDGAHLQNDRIFTRSGVVLDHIDSLQRLLVLGVDGIERLVIRVDRSMHGPIEPNILSIRCSE